jgi:hypothetical protein
LGHNKTNQYIHPSYPLSQLSLNTIFQAPNTIKPCTLRHRNNSIGQTKNKFQNATRTPVNQQENLQQDQNKSQITYDKTSTSSLCNPIHIISVSI